MTITPKTFLWLSPGAIAVEKPSRDYCTSSQIFPVFFLNFEKILSVWENHVHSKQYLSTGQLPTFAIHHQLLLQRLAYYNAQTRIGFHFFSTYAFFFFTQNVFGSPKCCIMKTYYYCLIFCHHQCCMHQYYCSLCVS